MVAVALIGADGVGKTTIARRLEDAKSLPIKSIYMGVNPEACNYALPTTRLVLKIRRWLGKETHGGGPPDRRRREPVQRSPLKRGLSGLKAVCRLANQLCEEWYRQCVAWYYQGRGFVVLFDRHFFPDYYAHDIIGEPDKRPLSRRIHGFVLNKLYPRPDLFILLDAPAQVLFDRKGEGTVELVNQRRDEYFQLSRLIPAFTVVNADQPLDAVVGEVLGIIQEFRNQKGQS